MIQIRPLEPSDYDIVSPKLDEWWGGRPVRQMLPRLFFEHFSTTSFATVDGEELVAFLVGFLSQSQPHVAYIHFVGVSPACRKKGYGRMLYDRFTDVAKSHGCTEIQCITSPVNVDSIAFHSRMGFEVVEGDGEHNGISIFMNHAGEGQPRVVFRKRLA